MHDRQKSPLCAIISQSPPLLVVCSRVLYALSYVLQRIAVIVPLDLLQAHQSSDIIMSSSSDIMYNNNNNIMQHFAQYVFSISIMRMHNRAHLQYYNLIITLPNLFTSILLFPILAIQVRIIYTECMSIVVAP